jgi:hypothetical protein
VAWIIAFSGRPRSDGHTPYSPGLENTDRLIRDLPSGFEQQLILVIADRFRQYHPGF